MLLAYWYITLIFTLPFFFTFMLLHNASLSIWHVNGLICLVILALFADWVAYIILLVIGVSLGVIIFYLTQPDAFIPYELRGVILSYIAPIIYIMLFSTKKEHIHQAKHKSLQAQAAAIAHEMRTPLSAVEAMAEGLKMHLPTLIQNQKISQEKDQSISRISKKKLQSLQNIPQGLIRISRSAFTVVDMLLMNLKENIPETASEPCSIQECVKTALYEYSLTDKEKELITLDLNLNFKFLGNSLLIKHVLFNLLKNALYYLKAANKGNITIWAEKEDKVNKLHFKDTGKGISKENLPYIFDQFFSRTAYGAGVGLAFCKLVMKKLGGDITCESIEGEFTQFTLSFPVLENDVL